MSVFTVNFDGFWRKENDSSVPRVAGIYVVYRCTHNRPAKTVSLHEILYIGESENVGDRIVSHDRSGDWSKRLKAGEELCFAVAPISGKDRERVEAALIYKHKPPLNDEYRDNFPFPPTRVISTGKTGMLVTDFTVSPAQSLYKGW